MRSFCLSPIKRHSSFACTPQRQVLSITYFLSDHHNVKWWMSCLVLTMKLKLFSTWIILQLYCFKMTHKVGHFWHDVLTLSTWKILPWKAQGHSRHFRGHMWPLMLLCDHSNWLVDREGGVARGQAGQESLESCDETPRRCWEWLRETKKQSCGIAASLWVKKRSVATGSGEKLPQATALNESTSPEVCIPAA